MEPLLELIDLTLVPMHVLMKLGHQNVILLLALADALLCFLSSFYSVADDNSREICCCAEAGQELTTWLLLGSKRCCMLLVGCL